MSCNCKCNDEIRVDFELNWVLENEWNFTIDTNGGIFEINLDEKALEHLTDIVLKCWNDYVEECNSN